MSGKGKPRLSPSKRKHGEEAAAAQEGLAVGQRRLSGVFRGSKPGQQPAQRNGKAVPNELKGLGVAPDAVHTVPAGADRRVTRGLLEAGDKRQLRSTTSVPPPTPQTLPQPGGPPADAKRPRGAASKAAKPAGARAAAAKPAKGKAAAGRAAAAQQGRQRRVHLGEAEIDGETFRVGEAVYVVMDTAAVQGLSEEGEEECECIVCGDTDVEERVMLECDRCLAGCHLACLTPPLQEVPEGEWVCPSCAAGRAPKARGPRTARECFLHRHGLSLARIEAIWEEPNGERHCTLRWYCVPEDTHTGRQAHHLAREVFLTQQRDANSMDCLLRHAHVLPPSQFRCGATCSALGEDVFVCEYQYDSAWQRFRRTTEFDSDSEDEGDEWAPPAGSDSDGDEAEDFDPAHETFAEHGVMPGGGVRRKAGGGRKAGGVRGAINRRKQGGEEFLAQVGALAVPEHTRQQQRGGGGALSQARSMLTLASVPRSLPCRETERAQVVEFVEEVLSEDGGKCLYISGIPGTGKTATVLEVMRSLKRRSEAGDLPKFQFVEINGLRLPSPQHAYSALYEALTGDRAGPQTAAQALEEMFGGGGGKAGAARRPTIVLVDEMDLLVNKTQTVLYNLFEWPGRKGSRLSIIGIANTMDLPERLHPRIGSRLAGRRVVFQPYSKEQLTTIIKSRLEGVPAFNAQALEFVSRKVANYSGDVRRCLELCRRAAEIAEERLRNQQRQLEEQQQQQQDGSPATRASTSDEPSGSQQRQETGIVEMRHVGAAIAEMFNTGHVKRLRETCCLERLLLAAIYMETSSSGRADCLLIDAWERVRILCSQNCVTQRYELGDLVVAAATLGGERIIICDPGVRRVRIKVALNVAVNDLLMVLAGDTDMPWLEQAISRAAVAPVLVPAE